MQFPDAVALTIIPDRTDGTYQPELRPLHDMRAVEMTDDEDLACNTFVNNHSDTFTALIDGTEEQVRLCNARALVGYLQQKELEVKGSEIPKPSALCFFWA